MIEEEGFGIVIRGMEEGEVRRRARRTEEGRMRRRRRGKALNVSEGRAFDTGDEAMCRRRRSTRKRMVEEFEARRTEG